MDYLAAKYRLSSYEVDILVASYGCFPPNTTLKRMQYGYDRYPFSYDKSMIDTCLKNHLSYLLH